MHEGCIIPSTRMDQRLILDALEPLHHSSVCKLHFGLSRREDVNILLYSIVFASLLFWDKQS